MADPTDNRPTPDEPLAFPDDKRDHSPRRTRLSRRAGARGIEPGSVKVDRSTRWGNPFAVGESVVVIWEDHLTAADSIRPEHAVDWYRMWLAGVVTIPGHAPAPTKAEIQGALRGRDLACWCGLDAVCHADTLLTVANL